MPLRGTTYHPGSLTREEEKKLVLRAVKRDATAFAELYDRHVLRIYRHVYYIAGGSHTAEDLTAQTFLKAWETIHRYKERGAPFGSWLLRISHNLSISYLRSRRDHSELYENLTDNKCRQPEEAAEQADDEQSMREAILKLCVEQRKVITLRFVDELSYREVAYIIGKSVPATRVLQHRALANLRKKMAQQ